VLTAWKIIYFVNSFIQNQNRKARNKNDCQNRNRT
jgi:hypothetical protein